jgi:acyl-CoA synthetase (AMP-forming)/AMP-acid ligase II
MPTIDSVVSRGASAAPDNIAVREWGSDVQLTYAQLDTAVSRFAAWARSHGLEAGQTIAIHLPNSANFLIAQFGSFRAGGVAAYINYRLSVAEACRQFRLCNARIIVTTTAKALALRAGPDLADVVFVLVDGTLPLDHKLAEIVATEQPLSYDANADGREDCDALIRFTSGSTGDPKGVIVSHRAWLIRAVSVLAEELQIVPFSITLVLGPLSHQAGLFVIPTFLRYGTLLVMDKFDVGSVADVFTSERISCSQMVPTILGLVLNDARSREALRGSGLSRLVYGGSPIRKAVLDEALALLPDTEFIQGYGSHEAGSISYLDGAAHRRADLRVSAGRPFLVSQVRLRRAEGETIGEIEVKAPWLPHARITEQGRELIDSEWSSTGDLGEMVNGYIFLRDRMNDVIVSGGFNVYPAEVEKVIATHPSVLDSAIVSAPDDKWGERVIAFVVPRDTASFSERHLREHCESLLAGYKVPKEIRLVAEIPLNASGKPDRRQLSEAMWAGQDRRIN